MISPTFEKARSYVALDACAHSRRLAKSAISGWPWPYLHHHFNTLQSLKSVPIICDLFNQLLAVDAQSSANEYVTRDFLGFVVAPRCKLDFHHSSPGCSNVVCSLASPSYSDDDALHPRVFLCINCTQSQKQRWCLGSAFQSGGHSSDRSTLTWSAMFRCTSDIKFDLLLY